MKEVLLEELSDDDIQWLKQIGHQQQVKANSVLIEQNQPVNFFYIIIDGELIATVSRNETSRLGQAFAAIEDDNTLEQEIAHFSSGEVLGEIAFLALKTAVNSVRAKEDSLVLAIPHQELITKLQEDVGFAARFYRALTILLLARFQDLLKIYLSRRMGQVASLQDVPMIFGELSDTDVDWMLQNGHLEKVPVDTLLMQIDQQVENLYVLIQGTMSVSVQEKKGNRLTNIFATLESDQESSESLGREISQVSRGEIMGEIASLDFHRSPSTIKALEDSLVLVIPRGKLLLKLQQDLGMAARFYRVLAILLSGRIQGLISRLGFGRSSYQFGQSLSQNAQYEDEIDLELMDNLTLGGARFDWMLRRLRVS